LLFKELLIQSAAKSSGGWIVVHELPVVLKKTALRILNISEGWL
jgi:hypothetical protein